MSAVCMRASSTPRCCLRALSQARVAGLCCPTKCTNSARRRARRVALRRWAYLDAQRRPKPRTYSATKAS
eukprot:1219479-Pleurochrysis_carterae.AAC.1